MLLVKALEYGLEKLNRKGIEFYKKEFVEIFLSVAFFRIPSFRKVFLNCLEEIKAAHIEEWRGAEWDIHEEEKEQIYGSIRHVFDWKGNFYDHIPEDQPDRIKAEKILGKLLGYNNWKNRLKARGTAYFLVISQWAMHVEN